MSQKRDTHPTFSRRHFVGFGAAATVLLGCSQPSDIAEVSVRTPIDFDALELRSQGEIGVAAINMATGEVLSHRGDQRFAMCSTFKWLLGALILRKVDQGDEDLDRYIQYAKEDLVYHSPETAPHADGAGMTISQLCSATIRTSDNTAANLLIASLGGPEGFTAMVRELGDEVTRLDRLEPALNENAPNDPRDTTTPLAMLGLMQACLFGDVLKDGSRKTLHGWMILANTGLDRLRAGFPAGWLAGDKTGTSSNRANNDVGFAVAPEGLAQGPIIVVSFTNVPNPTDSAANSIHAAIAEDVCGALI
ncbi:class A beta-lactamase [Hirschia litorea]|uniref:Beta-lactamase n=1 Tax=Hirschia litorea TaxID=1199156 RepID=A0ABW2IL37_9PROT